MIKDFIIDAETLADKPNSIVVDVSVVVFDPDPTIVQSFDELVASGRRFKIDLKSQKGVRLAQQQTIDWWKEQSQEARQHLAPSDEDVTIEQATTEILDYLKKSGVNRWNSQGWCRGQSFDFPLFVDMISQTYKTNYTRDIEPVMFWQQRDIRTAIEAYSLQRGTLMTPLRKGILDGFVAHNSIHDCVKDVIMLKTAQRYAYGLEEMPEEKDIDPTTVKKKRNI